MAEDLGEIKVSVQQEGAEQAAETIGDAAGEAQDQGMAGDGGGAAAGTIGEMLGGISTKLAGILGIVGVLSALKPVQEFLKGIMRILSIALLPFIQLLNVFLKPVLQELLGLIGNIDFQTTLDEFITRFETLLRSVWNDAVSSLISALNQIPGVNLNQGGRPPGPSESGFDERQTTVPGVTAGDLSEDPFPVLGNLAQNGQDVYVSPFGEQSNTNMNRNASETTNNETGQNGLGGIFR